MPNTPLGFPYPDPDEPVAEGAAAIRALAEAIDAKVTVVLDDLTVAGAVLAAYDTDVRLGVNAIPQTFKALFLHILARSDAAGAGYLTGQFNGDAGANYYASLGGANLAGAFVGVAVNAATALRLGWCVPSSGAANDFAASRLELPDYASASKRQKLWLQSAYSYGLAGGGEWSGIAAVTRIRILPDVGNFAIGSRFTLLGVGR